MDIAATGGRGGGDLHPFVANHGRPEDAETTVLVRHSWGSAVAGLHRARHTAYRYLALLCVADFLVITATWVLIISQSTTGFSYEFLKTSILDFSFIKSLFDVVAISFLRAFLLLLVYWVNWSTHMGTLVVITTLSVGFLIAKVVYPQLRAGSRPPVEYAVLVEGFLFPVFEATLYVAQIQGLNRKLRAYYAKGGPVLPTAATATTATARRGDPTPPPGRLAGYGTSAQAEQGAAAVGPTTAPRAIGVGARASDLPPYDTSMGMFVDASESYVEFSHGTSAGQHSDGRHGSSGGGLDQSFMDLDFESATESFYSDAESDAFRTPGATSPAGSATPSVNSITPDWIGAEVTDALRHLSPVDIQYIRGGSDALQATWDTALTDLDFEAAKGGVRISSRTNGAHKVFKSEGLVYGSPQDVFSLVHDSFAQQPTWDRHIKQAEILQSIDTYTDVVYTVVAEQAGGLVAARDFVDVRRWKMQDGNFVLAFTGVMHAAKPIRRKYVRGQHGHSGFVVLAVDNQPNVSNLVWVLDANLNLSNWLPKRIVEQATCNMLLGFHESVRAVLEARASSRVAQQRAGSRGRSSASNNSV